MCQLWNDGGRLLQSLDYLQPVGPRHQFPEASGKYLNMNGTVFRLTAITNVSEIKYGDVNSFIA